MDFIEAYEQALADGNLDRERNAAYGALLDDLTYPAARDGSIIDLRHLAAGIGWHLIRRGWRPHPDRALVKKRTVSGPGVVEDARVWVPVTDPDDPLADLDNMSMAEINALPEDLAIAAKRRLGILPPAPDPAPGWQVAPSLHISDEPDTNDIDWR